MTPEHWQKVKLIIEEALEFQGAKQEEFLLSVCGEDKELYDEVKNLIAADEAANSFLEIPAHKLVPDSDLHTKKITQGKKTVAPELKIGELFLGKYELVKLIGTGGMGQVYQARHIDLSTMVAIKVLNTYWTQDDDAIERFKREARTAAKLDHPNTVRVFDYGVAEKTCYLIMECLEGETLRKRLSDNKQMSLTQVIDFAKQVCQALSMIHSKGVVHRDLKPDNIFFHQKDGREVVKLLDFGIAKLTTFTQGGAPLTNPGDIFGTPHYMSPEQCQGKSLDGRSDIYSLGIILYEMLAGRNPFEADSTLSFMYAHVNTPAPDLIEFAPDLPMALCQVVMKSIAKDVRERTQTAEELWQALSDTANSTISNRANLVTVQNKLPISKLPSVATTANTLIVKKQEEKGITTDKLWKMNYLLTAAVIVVALSSGFGLWSLSEKLSTSATPINTSASTVNKNLETPKILTTSTNIPDLSQFVLIPSAMAKIGRELTDCLEIPGCKIPDEEVPEHLVELESYYLSKYEVTNKEYQEFVLDSAYTPPEHWKGNNFPINTEDYPVTKVSWEDANNYCKWRSKKDGISYRLPTEEEWEYAARGNTNNHFPWGNLWKEGLANIAVADENRNPLPINQAPNITTDKSPFGIFSMAGNISEWTSSSFRLYPNSNYKFKKSDLECKIIRGGNFSNAVVDSRTSSRIWDLPNTLQEDLGFRLAVSAK